MTTATTVCKTEYRVRLCAEEALPSCRVKSPSAPKLWTFQSLAYDLAADLSKVVCVQPFVI